MQLNNNQKKEHGKNAQDCLETLLKFCKKKKYITKYQKNYRIGYENYSENQFYAPFIIFFSENEKWILFSTTTMRTDRIKGQQWDSYNIKNLDSSITRCILVYPDSVNKKVENDFIRQNNKYKTKNEFSAIDNIISQNKLFNLIENNANKSKNKGQIKNIQGNVFEERISDILSSKSNLQKWKKQDKINVGLNYKIYKYLVDFFNLNPTTTINIKATSNVKDIGLLPSRGKPKTDILMTVYDSNNSISKFTISCKRSSSKSVSVHQYSAQTFSNVLAPKNQNLAKLLHEFQICGNLRDFGEDNSQKLTNALKPYKENLAFWAFGGIGGSGDSNIQWANYLLTYINNSDNVKIYTIKDYYNKLVTNNVKGHFGTVFTWTYASKQRGKSIQLKSKIL